jgi:hypothetical protein
MPLQIEFVPRLDTPVPANDGTPVSYIKIQSAEEVAAALDLSVKADPLVPTKVQLEAMR